MVSTFPKSLLRIQIKIVMVLKMELAMTMRIPSRTPTLAIALLIATRTKSVMTAVSTKVLKLLGSMPMLIWMGISTLIIGNSAKTAVTAQKRSKSLNLP